MPSILEAPEFLELEHIATQPLTTAQPEVYEAPKGFWHLLAQLVRRPQADSFFCTAQYYQVGQVRLETPVERLARTDPALYIRASCGI